MSKSNEQNLTTWPGYIGNLTTSAIAGTLSKGLAGGVVAASATLADEFLINKGYTAKHYLTTSSLWGSLVIPVGQTLAETFPEWSTLIYGASLATIGAISYYSHDPLNYQQKVNDTTNYLAPLVKLLDDKNLLTKEEVHKVYKLLKSNPYEGTKLAIADLKYLLSNKLVITTAGNTLIQILELYITNSCNKYIGNNGTTMLALTLIQKNPEAGMLELGHAGVKILSLFLGKSVIICGLALCTSYLDADLKKSISIKSIDQLLLNKEHIHKILGVDDSAAVTANLNSDLQNCLNIGKGFLKSISSDKIAEISALSEVITLAPEALILQQICGFLRKFITELVQTKLILDQVGISKIDADQGALVWDLSTNFGNAVLTDSTEFIKAKYNDNTNKREAIEFNSILWKKFEQLSLSALDIAQMSIDMFYYLYKISNNQLTIEQAPFLYKWLEQSSPFLQGGSTLNFPAAVVAQERIFKLLKAISSDTDTRAIASHSFNDSNKIIIDNYKLKIKDLVALNINHLELPINKHYAISGDSGLGKTSFLKDVQGCLTNPLSSSGEISLPKINGREANTMFIDQNLYIPAKATLFEAITLKASSMLDTNAKLDLKTKIIKLFKELTIDEPAGRGDESTGLIAELDNSTFSTSSLSGGQKKKVGIIKAILAKPEILIMDEIFVGLDPESLKTAQKAITKYLKDTTIIIVDHTAKANNHEQFYDVEINFTKDGYTWATFDSEYHSQLEHLEPKILGSVEGNFDHYE